MYPKNRTSLLTGIIFLLLGLLANSVYLKFLGGNSIGQFKLVGTLPSLLVVIGLSLVFQIKSYRYPYLVMPAITIGSVIYEFKESLTSGILEINNIIASVIGGIIAVLIWFLIEKKYRNLKE